MVSTRVPGVVSSYKVAQARLEISPKDNRRRSEVAAEIGLASKFLRPNRSKKSHCETIWECQPGMQIAGVMDTKGQEWRLWGELEDLLDH